MQEAATTAQSIPLLRSEIERAKARENELKSAIKNLNRDLKASKDEVQAAAVKFNQAEFEHQSAASDAAARLHALEEECAAVREGLTEVTQQKVELLMRISRTEAGRARADAQIVQLKESLSATQEQLKAATQDKVRALMQIAELEAEVSGSESNRDRELKQLHKRSPQPSSPAPEKKDGKNDRWRWIGSSASSLGRSP